MFILSCLSDNYSLPENTSRSCWPVRPIPRRTLLNDSINEPHSLNASSATQIGSNAAIGVVIPTTPNSALHHQQQNHLNEQLLQHSHQQHIHHNLAPHHSASHSNLRRTNISPDYITSETSSLLSMRVPDGAPQQVSISNNLLHHNIQSVAAIAAARTSGMATNNCAPHPTINAINVEERLNQIQDYIRITTSLIDSIHADKVSDSQWNSICNYIHAMHSALDIIETRMNLDYENRLTEVENCVKSWSSLATNGLTRWSMFKFPRIQTLFFFVLLAGKLFLKTIFIRAHKFSRLFTLTLQIRPLRVKETEKHPHQKYQNKMCELNVLEEI